MLMKMTFILTLLFVLSCAQTIPLGFRWDKNTEPDMSHYDLFTLVLSDSEAFYSLTEWPADTSVKNVYIDSTVHMPNLLATLAHIYSPIDSMVFQWTKTREQAFLRGYILAADSTGNMSAIATSINIVYIGDRDAPLMPGQNLIFKRNQ